jgi:hypothetical protein
MKNYMLIGLIAIVLFMISCDSTNLGKIFEVQVSGDGVEPHFVELTHSVTLPISLSEAMFIMPQCWEEYNASLGEPVFNDGVWYFFWGPQYPDWEISVDSDTGDVVIGMFG